MLYYLCSTALVEDLRAAKVDLDAARPTAVNLTWATSRIVDIAAAYMSAPGMTAEALRDHVLDEAQKLAEEDVKINTAIAKHGAALVPQDANVLHHCNTGALATVDVGTALGVIYGAQRLRVLLCLATAVSHVHTAILAPRCAVRRSAECHKSGKNVHVWVDETRPRLQGAKLTAWELMRGGVPMHLIADNAAGHLMQRGRVDVVLFGADRVAANGDVANKIGTYKLCVVARENGVPAYACVPTSTVDLTLPTGDGIFIEERGAEEVTHIGDTCIAPPGVPVFNPAFDVTPFRYLTGIITEEGVCYPPYSVSLRRAKESAEARRAAEWRAKLADIGAAHATGSA